MSIRSTWAFQLARMGDLIVSFGWQIIAARLLAPAEFGVVAIGTAVATFVVIIMSIGGDELMSSSSPGAMSSVFRGEAKRRLLVAGVSLVGAVACYPVLPVVAAVMAYSAAFALANLSMAYLTRAYRARLLGTGIVAQGIAVVALIFLPGAADPAGVILAVAGAVGLRALITFIPVWLLTRPRAAVDMGLQGSPVTSVRPTRTAGILRRLSIMFSAASGPLLGRQMHVTLAGALGVSLELIGAYSVAYSLAYLASTVTILGIAATALPRISDAAATGRRKELAASWRHVVLSTSALSIPALALSAAIAPSLIGLVYGAAYVETASQFYVGLVAILAVQRLMGGGANNALMIATARSGALFLSILIAFAVAAGIDLLLMPQIGMWAAIVAGVASTACSAGFALVIARQTHGAGPPITAQAKTLAITGAATIVSLALIHVLLIESDLVKITIAALAGLITLFAIERLVLRPAR